LGALLATEMEERESRAISRLLHEARLPRMKRLETFEFNRSGVSAGSCARWRRATTWPDGCMNKGPDQSSFPIPRKGGAKPIAAEETAEIAAVEE